MRRVLHLRHLRILASVHGRPCHRASPELTHDTHIESKFHLCEKLLHRSSVIFKRARLLCEGHGLLPLQGDFLCVREAHAFLYCNVSANFIPFTVYFAGADQSCSPQLAWLSSCTVVMRTIGSIYRLAATFLCS